MTLAIHLTNAGDLAEVAEEGLRLRRELVDLHLGPVEAPRSGELPAGAKAAGPHATGILEITLAASPGLLAAVVTTVRAWLSRSQARSIKLVLGDDVLELAGLSTTVQDRLAEEWLQRHDGGGEAEPDHA